jgi:hypothetical protein
VFGPTQPSFQENEYHYVGRASTHVVARLASTSISLFPHSFYKYFHVNFIQIISFYFL